MKQYLTEEQESKLLDGLKCKGWRQDEDWMVLHDGEEFKEVVHVDTVKEIGLAAIADWINSQSGELPEPGYVLHIAPYQHGNEWNELRYYTEDQLREAIAAAKGKMGEPVARINDKGEIDPTVRGVFVLKPGMELFTHPSQQATQPKKIGLLTPEELADPEYVQSYIEQHNDTIAYLLSELKKAKMQPATQAQPVIKT